MRRRLDSEQRLGVWLLAPAVATVALVALYPVLAVLWTSLFKVRPIFGIHEWVGLRNYAHLLQDTRFWGALGNTLYFTVCSVGLEFLLGLALALQLRAAIRGQGLFRIAVLIPWALPTVISARMWELILNPDYGVLNYAIQRLGALLTGLGLPAGGLLQPLNWMGQPVLALHAAILADVWKTTPFVVLLLLAGLLGIPADLDKAARLDGATSWQRFWLISWPLLRPTLLVTLLFRSLDAFRAFDLIYVLTGGGPADSTETLSIYTYKTLFGLSLTGYGSALAMVSFLGVLVLSYFYLRLLEV